MNMSRYATCALLLMSASFLQRHAQASSVTLTGTPPPLTGSFTADNEVLQFDFSATGTQNYTFATTSYAKGGFVPYLTLFSSAGNVLGYDGADGACGTAGCDDAFLQTTLGAGSYILALTEFPNVFTGTLAQGTLFASDPDATGTACGAGGQFLKTDDGSCSQRTSNYAVTLNSTSPVPEPSSLLLLLPAVAFIAVKSRSLLS